MHRVLTKNDPLMELAVATLLMFAPAALHAQSPADTLPDAPSALLFSSSTTSQSNAMPMEAQNAAPDSSQNNSPQNSSSQNSAPQQTKTPTPLLPQPTAPDASQPLRPPQPAGPAQASADQAASAVLPCPKSQRRREESFIFPSSTTQPTCEDQLQLIVDTGYIKPLTPTEKGILAIRAVIDPFNLLTIATFSGISVAADPHSDYGPGFTGWGRLAGYSLAEDIQGEFTGVYLIPVLTHEDPRYHRMPKATVRRRIEHALIHTFVTQHDDGALMPNYATLINDPLSAEISNLYVPGIGTNAPDTAKRVLVGYATDPIGPLVAEFLPDVAKRVHIHIIFAQQILNRIALGSGAQSGSF